MIQHIYYEIKDANRKLYQAKSVLERIVQLVEKEDRRNAETARREAVHSEARHEPEGRLPAGLDGKSSGKPDVGTRDVGESDKEGGGSPGKGGD